MNYFIYGGGGHAKVVLEAMQLSNLKCKGFIDDKAIDSHMNLPVYDLAFLSSKKYKKLTIHIAVGDCLARAKISSALNNFLFFSVFHPQAIISNSAVLGMGSFFAAGSIVGPDAQVGMHSIVNHHAIVDHDCIVGDFCHIAPHASLGGGVSVGKGVLIGTGAIVLPGIKIADYATVGAGSVVTHDIESSSTVIGNPARAI